MSVYSYHGTFYTHHYHLFSFDIVADSTEDANAKAEEYFKNEANHESIVLDSEENCENFRMPDLKRYFLENAQVDRAVREEYEEEEEEFHVWMSMEE